MSEVEEWLLAHQDQALQTLIEFCRIPSVSTDPAYVSGLARAAEFVAQHLTQAGFPDVEVVETGGAPCVLAEWCDARGAPTVLVYGHYDVQPPDPVVKWHSPPFAPEIRDGKVYARGASDDKGPLLIPILVAAAFKAVHGRLPLNLKILVEGEEETGSPHFDVTVARLRDRLVCDLVVSADGAMWRADLPSVIVACRGLVALEVTVEGAAKDLHSGRHGGTAPNPIRVLTQILATLHDAQGCVQVADFSQGALPPDPLIKIAIRDVGFDSSGYFADIGATEPVPLPSGVDLLTHQWLCPTLEFNGISGGYHGPGIKTVIPSQASVKITCRLVAGQMPDAVTAAIARHLRAVVPAGFRLLVVQQGPGTPAVALDPALPALRTAECILTDLMGRAPVRIAMGATVPFAEVFARRLGIGTIFFSFATSDEDYHAPNEHFRLSSFRIGQIAWARLFEHLARSE